MSENKEYLSRVEDMGSINISEEVIASIAAIAVGEVEGVGFSSGMGSDIAEFLGKRPSSKGIKVILGDDSIRVDCYVMVGFGYTVKDVAMAVQQSVKSAIESMTGLEVSAVNVSVGGITFEK